MRCRQWGDLLMYLFNFFRFNFYILAKNLHFLMLGRFSCTAANGTGCVCVRERERLKNISVVVIVLLVPVMTS